jgi:hypothetical protein
VQQYADHIAGVTPDGSPENGKGPLRRYFVNKAKAPFQSCGGGFFRWSRIRA